MVPLPSLSRTLKAIRIMSSSLMVPILADIMLQNSGNSIWPDPSVSYWKNRNSKKLYLKFIKYDRHFPIVSLGHGKYNHFHYLSTKERQETKVVSYFIDEVEEFGFCWVHPHRPHGIAKLPCVDRPAAVHVKFIKSLFQLGDLLLAKRVRHVWCRWTGWWRWTGGSGRGLVAAERERQLMRELAQPSLTSGRGKYE